MIPTRRERPLKTFITVVRRRCLTCIFVAAVVSILWNINSCVSGRVKTRVELSSSVINSETSAYHDGERIIAGA